MLQVGPRNAWDRGARMGALKSSAAGSIISGGGEALFLFPALRLRLRLGASAILRTGALATLVASTFQAAACRALHRIALLGRLSRTCDATAINRALRRGVDRIHGRNGENGTDSSPVREMAFLPIALASFGRNCLTLRIFRGWRPSPAFVLRHDS